MSLLTLIREVCGEYEATKGDERKDAYEITKKDEKSPPETGRAESPYHRPAELARWPIEWRQRWGELANQLQDQGVPWPDHEQQAFDQVKAEKRARKAS